jgi:hypothetical protein
MTSETYAAYSTSMPESPVLQYGLHPSNTIRQILQKRQRVRKMEQQVWIQGGGGFHKTRITQSMRYNILIMLKPMLKDKEDWHKKI